MALQEPLTKLADIAHVLAIDIVDFDQLPESARGRFQAELVQVVRDSPTYRARSDAEGVLLIPDAAGVTLVFTSDLIAPANCAIEILETVKTLPFHVRMGVNSGHVQWMTEVHGLAKVTGKGINLAQRVMELAEPGHILLAYQYATWLAQYDEWWPYIHVIGEATGTHGVKIAVANLASRELGNRIQPVVGEEIGEARAEDKLSVVLLYRRIAEPDGEVVHFLEEQLKKEGHDVFIDRDIQVGVDWAKEIEARIRAADAIVAVVSDNSSGSEMLEYEVDLALTEYRQRGRPFVLPVRVGSAMPLEGELGTLLNPLQFIQWNGPQDGPNTIKSLKEAFARPSWKVEAKPLLEPVGGAIPLDSNLYIERSTDNIFLDAIRSQHSIILVKGPRQIGKTSLIARGANLAEHLGSRTIVTDFQKVSSSHLGAEDIFYRMLAAVLANQLGFEYDFDKKWLDAFGPNINMDLFVREALLASEEPVVWFMDEADRIFGLPFASEFFGLVRAWHNSRAIEPRGPWQKFTLVIGYATEAHLFIRDLNQSPFNVGLHIPLKFFTYEQTADLNHRHGSPIRDENEIRQLHSLVGGQPFLTRRALDFLARKQVDFDALMATAHREDGPFGDHLKRILVSVCHIPDVEEALRSVFTDHSHRESDAFNRLVTAGVLVVNEQDKVEYRTPLYKRFLEEHGLGRR